MSLLRIEKRYINIDYSDKKKRILSDITVCKKPAKKYIKKIIYEKEKAKGVHDIFNPETRPYSPKISTVLIKEDVYEKNIPKYNKIKKALECKKINKPLSYKINNNINHSDDKNLTNIKNDLYSNWMKNDKEFFENARKYNQTWYERFIVFFKNFLKSFDKSFLIKFIKINNLCAYEISKLEKLSNDELATIIIDNVLENFKVTSIFSIYTLMIFFLCQYYLWHRKSILKEIKWIENFSQSNSYTKKMIVKLYTKGPPFDKILPSNSIQSAVFRRLSRLNPWIINNNIFYINRVNGFITNSRWGNRPISIFILLARFLRWLRGY